MIQCRPIAAWTVYLAGDAVSRVMGLHDWLSYLYPIYSRLMQWSDTIQGPSDHGPWSAIASADTLPKGQDAQQGLAGTESGAVPEGQTPKGISNA